MKGIKKFVVLLTSIAVLASIGTGCGEKKPTSSEIKNDEMITLPLKEPITIKYWKQQYKILSSMMNDYNNTPFYKELEKRTGVKVEFIFPAQGQEQEQFNIMIASAELPDVVEGGFRFYSGGLQKAYVDENIIKLNDYLDKGMAPNLKKLISENPEFAREAKADGGEVLAFPYARLEKSLRTFTGPIVRKDWLDELGMKAPETVEEWHSVLKAFKERKGSAAPLTFQPWQLKSYPVFHSAFGITPTQNGFFLRNGEIQYYAIDSGYKEFLSTMKQWYSEGLIDPEFALINTTAIDARIINGESGAFIGAAGSGVGKFLDLLKTKNPRADLIGVSSPVKNVGEKPKFSHLEPVIDSAGSVVITSKNKHIKETVAWLDYGYSKEGHLLNNFGIEGTTYTMQENTPKFNEMIFKNPEGKSVDQAMALYVRMANKGPFIQDSGAYEQYMKYDQQKEALKAWGNAENKDYLPPVSATAEESSIEARKQTEINTYVDEMFIKFVMGVEPLEKYDEYVGKVKKMGIEDIMNIKKAQLERYNKR